MKDRKASRPGRPREWRPMGGQWVDGNGNLAAGVDGELRPKKRVRTHFSTTNRANSFATVLPRPTGFGGSQRVRAGRARGRTTRDVCKASSAFMFSDPSRL